MARDGDYIVAGHPDWPVTFVGDAARPYLFWREPWFPAYEGHAGIASSEDEAVLALWNTLEHQGIDHEVEFVDVVKPVAQEPGGVVVGWVKVRIPLDEREIVPKGTKNVVIAS